jgi:hypothetical protein
LLLLNGNSYHRIELIRAVGGAILGSSRSTVTNSPIFSSIRVFTSLLEAIKIVWAIDRVALIDAAATFLKATAGKALF